MNKVDNLQDIPELYLDETMIKETPQMVTTATGPRGPNKKTVLALDKMVQFIWDYQDKHNGETPKLNVIAANAGVTNASSATLFMKRLIDEGRVNKISSNPFRVSLVTDHPQNKRAIESFRRLRSAREAFESQERDRIRARQAEEATTDQHETDTQALFAAHDTQVVERPAPLPSVAFTPKAEQSVSTVPETSPTETVAKFLRTRQDSTAATRDLKRVMPQIIKVAETRDLLMELTDRGYTVSKR